LVLAPKPQPPIPNPHRLLFKQKLRVS